MHNTVTDLLPKFEVLERMTELLLTRVIKTIDGFRFDVNDEPKKLLISQIQDCNWALLNMKNSLAYLQETL